MKRKLKILLAIVGVLLLGPLGVAAEKPNFIVINIDDLGYADIGPYGSNNRTPHLDRMAAEGRKLTSHYAAPVCSPSRAALMTGCYPKRSLPIPHVLFPAAAVGLNPNERTIAEVLHDAGYATGCIGKWHLGDQPEFLPTAQGFDYYFGIPYSNDMGPAAEGAKSNRDRPLPSVRNNARQAALQGGDETGLKGNAQTPLPLLENDKVVERVGAAEQLTVTRRYTDKAIQFLRDHQREPFFLYLPHTAVHFPLYPSDEHVGQSPNGLLGDWVQEVDASVGRVLAAVRELGLSDNTLVLFTSDNGGSLAHGSNNQPLRGAKGSTFEGGIRTCTIAWWPGKIPAGSSTTSMTSMMDVLPTFAKLAGASLPLDRKIDGLDIWPVLSGPPQTATRDSFFYFRGFKLEAVRSGPWKLHLALADGGTKKKGVPRQQLFHLETDLGEESDVAAENPEIVKKLLALAETQRDDLGWDGIGDGCRPLGRVENPQPLIDRDGQIREGFAAAQPRASSPGAAEKSLPNVVLIVADDMGYADLGVQGARGFQTPHLDQLAASGTRFTHFYVPQAVCTASRAGLLTGAYPNRIGMQGAYNHTSRDGVHQDEWLLPEMLRERGYATAGMGKWHLGTRIEFHPLRHGFDEWLGIPYSNDNSKYHPTLAPEMPPLPFYDGEKIVEYDPDQSQFTRRFTERAVQFMERNADRPFFLYMPHVMPHVPIFASEKFRGRSQAGLYGDVMEELDWSVGEIVATLRRLKLDSRTLVIFISDNGPFLSYGEHAGSAAPLREGKLTVFEGGVRVPCLVRWPGRVPAGRVCETPFLSLDWLPTLTELVGGQMPSRVIDGRSAKQMLFGERDAPSPHEAMFFYSGTALHAVRSGPWKLHFPHPYITVAGEPGRGGKPSNFGKLVPTAITQSGVEGIATRHGYRVEQLELSLFDLENDPGETRNLAQQHPEVVTRLTELAAKAREELGDSLRNIRGTGIRSPGVVPSETSSSATGR